MTVSASLDTSTTADFDTITPIMEGTTSSYAIDLEAQRGDGTTLNSEELSSIRKSSSREHRNSREPDLEAGDRIKQLGILGLSVYESGDVTNMIRRAFLEAASYCQVVQEQDIEKLWSELREAVRAKSSNHMELTRHLRKEICSYYDFTLQTKQICSLDQPERKSLVEYLDTANAKLSETPSQDREFLEADGRDWFRPFYMDKLESLVHQVMNYPIGRLIMRPSRWLRRQDETRTYEFYGRTVIEVLLFGGFIGIISAFVGIPVVLSVMNVTSKAGECITYLGFLIVFGIVSKALLAGFNLPLIATLAYAGILASSMKNGS